MPTTTARAQQLDTTEIKRDAEDPGVSSSPPGVSPAPPVKIPGPRQAAQEYPATPITRSMQTIPTSLLRVRTQIYDAKVMHWYWARKHTIPKDDMAALNALYDMTHNIAERKVAYEPKKEFGEKGYGRVYANGRGSLETLPRKYRENLCAKLYWDIDMVNAQPTLLRQYAERYGMAMPTIEAYCLDREPMLAAVMKAKNVSRAEAKQEFISYMFGAKGHEAITAEMHGLYSRLVEEPEWTPMIEIAKKSKPGNTNGCFCALLAQTLERNVLVAMDDFFTNRGRSVDVLAYDGLQIRKTEGDEEGGPTDLVRECEAYIEEQTNFRIALSIKAMVCSISKGELDGTIVPAAQRRMGLVEAGGLSNMALMYALECGWNISARGKIIPDRLGNVVYSLSEKCYFLYNEEEGIWRFDTPDDINNHFSDVMLTAFDEMLAALPATGNDKKSEAALEVIRKRKKINAVRKDVASNSTKYVSHHLKTYVTPSYDPKLKFNMNEDYYPCQNGCYSFKEARRVDYQREFFFTFKIPVMYDPTADMSAIQKAMSQWFRQEEEVVDFVKYWCGYSLTPSSIRQEFLVAWGESAGNGKSTLFSEILGSIMSVPDSGADKSFQHTLNAKDMLTTGGSNCDTVYNLVGKRSAIMSEPNVDGFQKIDGEMIKRLTGDVGFSTAAKYKAEITFKPVAKIVAMCNKMINVEMDDKGLYRRIVVLEMSAKFVEKEEYDSLSDDKRQSGGYHIRDPKLIEMIKSNLPGVLRYFLEGATSFVKDPMRRPPAQLQASKEKAAADLDELSQWVMGYLVKDDKKDAFVTLKQVKEYWRREETRFDGVRINAKGFNKSLFLKCERIGIKVKWNEARSDEGRFLGVKLLEIDDEAPVEATATPAFE